MKLLTEIITALGGTVACCIILLKFFGKQLDNLIEKKIDQASEKGLMKYEDQLARKKIAFEEKLKRELQLISKLTIEMQQLSITILKCEGCLRAVKYNNAVATSYQFEKGDIRSILKNLLAGIDQIESSRFEYTVYFPEDFLSHYGSIINQTREFCLETLRKIKQFNLTESEGQDMIKQITLIEDSIEKMSARLHKELEKRSV